MSGAGSEFPFVTPFVKRSGKGFSYYSYKEDLLYLGGTDGNPLVTLHEAIHFFVHAATPYGVFLDELSSGQLQLASRILQSIHGDILVPVAGWAATQWNRESPLSKGGLPELETAAGTCIESWEAFANLEAIFTPELTLPAITEQAAIDLLSRCEDLLAIPSQTGPEERSSLAACLTSRDAVPAIPAIPEVLWQWDPASQPTSRQVGSRQLDEAIAQLQEGLDASLWTPASIDYCLAFGVTASAYGLERCLQLPDGDRRLAITCLALADLSFFTPIGRMYGPLRTSAMTWVDLHPGHRFLRALDVVAREQLWIGSLDDMERTCGIICDRLGWVPPSEFLSLGASHGTDRHRSACDLRRRRFSCFYQFDGRSPEAAEISALLLQLGPIIYHASIGTHVPSIEPDDALYRARRVRDLYLNRLLHGVMCFPEQLIRMLPPGIPYQSLSIAAISNEVEFIRLMERRYPWASRSRLRLRR